VSTQDAWNWGRGGLRGALGAGQRVLPHRGAAGELGQGAGGDAQRRLRRRERRAVPLQEPRDLATVDTFDQLYAWYRHELVHAVDLGIRG